MLSASLSITPFAALSRPITGIRNKTMIITLPGSPKACKENMEACLKVLPHALDLLLDRSVKKLHEKIQQGDMDINKSGGGGGGHHHTCTHRHDLEGHEFQTGQSDSLDTPGKIAVTIRQTSLKICLYLFCKLSVSTCKIVSISINPSRKGP